MADRIDSPGKMLASLVDSYSKIQQEKNKVNMELYKERLKRDADFANSVMKSVVQDKMVRARQKDQYDYQRQAKRQDEIANLDNPTAPWKRQVQQDVKQSIGFEGMQKDDRDQRALTEYTKLGEYVKELKSQGKEVDPMTMNRYRFMGKKLGLVNKEDTTPKSYLQKQGAAQKVMDISSRIKQPKDITAILSNKEHFQKTLGFEEFNKLLDHIDKNIIPTFSDEQLQELIDAGIIEGE